MDVRGPVTHCLREDAVDDLDDRCVVRDDLWFGVVDVAPARTLDRFEHLHQLRDGTEGTVVAVDRPSHVAKRRDEQLDLLAARLTERIAQFLARFGDRDVQVVVDDPNRKGHVLSSGIFGQVVDHGRVDVVTAQVGDVEPEIRRERVRQRLFGECARAHEDLAQESAGVALHVQRLFELGFADQIAGDKLVAQAHVRLLRRRTVRRTVRPDRTCGSAVYGGPVRTGALVVSFDGRRDPASCRTRRVDVFVFALLFERHELPQRFSEKTSSDQTMYPDYRKFTLMEVQIPSPQEKIFIVLGHRKPVTVGRFSS